MATACKRCGRKLKAKSSVSQGMGPVCYAKLLKERVEVGIADNQITIFDDEENVNEWAKK